MLFSRGNRRWTSRQKDETLTGKKTAEAQLSPEEKLLKVIQDGGNEAGEREEAAETAATGYGIDGSDQNAVEEETAPADSADVGAAEPAGKPKLKIAGPRVSEGSLRPDDAVGPIIAAKTAATTRSLLKKRSDPVQNIGVVNKCLVAALILIVALSGLEIRANFKALAAERRREIRLPAPNNGGHEELRSSPEGTNLPPLEVMLPPFLKRSLFEIPEAGRSPQPRGPEPAPVIKARLTLIGLTYQDTDSGREAQAIVMDNKIGKMHFLTVGDTVSVDDSTLTLEEIHPDRVVFQGGKNRITVESGKSNE